MKLIKIGHPLLRKKTSRLPPEIIQDSRFKKWTKKLTKTMHAADGVGLAANQVAYDLQVFSMECRRNKRYPRAPHFPLQIYINPRIIGHGTKKLLDIEGCLSIPHYRGVVPRWDWVKLKALTPKGKKIEKIFRGFEARVVQHEVDHLNGKVYLDRMTSMKKLSHLDNFKI